LAPSFGPDVPPKHKFVNGITKILVWGAVVAVLFGVAWYKGYILQLSNYIAATREELRKCTWPTWAELKGSTVLITISIVLLGGFTVAADWIFVHVMFLISKI